MNGREIVDYMIRHRAEKYDLELEIEWYRCFGTSGQIANVRSGDQDLDLRFLDENIDDLPGHTKLDGNTPVARPRDDDFFEAIRSRVYSEIDRFARRLGRRIGF